MTEGSFSYRTTTRTLHQNSIINIVDKTNFLPNISQGFTESITRLLWPTRYKVIRRSRYLASEAILGKLYKALPYFSEHLLMTVRRGEGSSLK